METILQKLSDPVLLSSLALVFTGMFFPQLKTLPSKIGKFFPEKSVPVSPTNPNSKEFDPVDLASSLSTYFANDGDSEGTMLSVAIVKHILNYKEKQLLQLCEEVKQEKELKENNTVTTSTITWENKTRTSEGDSKDE